MIIWLTSKRLRDKKTRKRDEDDEDKLLEVNDIISGKGKGLIVLLYGQNLRLFFS